MNELDEFGDIKFIQKGKVGIGFEINKQRKLVLQYKNKCIVGAYGTTFNRRS